VDTQNTGEERGVRTNSEKTYRGGKMAPLLKFLPGDSTRRKDMKNPNKSEDQEF